MYTFNKMVSNLLLGTALLSAWAVHATPLSGLNFQTLPLNKKIEVNLNQDSPRFEFEDGNSAYAAFELPNTGAPAKLGIRSLVKNERIIQPTVLVLDAQKRPLRKFDGRAFPYEEARGFTPDSLYGEVQIQQSARAGDTNERYIVIYSNISQQAGSTTMTHPAKLYARARNNEPPAVKDPVIAHSDLGLIALEFKGRTEIQSQGETVYETRVGETAVATSKGSVMQETVVFYKKQVDKALAANDLNTALKWVDEAKRLGATEVEAHLIRAIQAR